MPARHSRRPNAGPVEQALASALELRPQLVATATRVLRHRDDASEVVDDAIERLHRELRDGAEIREIGAWLHRTVLHRAIDRARAWVRQQHHLQRYGDVVKQQGGSDEAAERAELQERVWRAILELPRRQQEVVILRDMEGHSFREIGEALDIGEATARSHAHAAREELRQRLAAWRATKGQGES